MSLSGQWRKQLQFALIDAFPTTASLEQMLAFELDKNLITIAGEGSLQEIVFRLIQAADAQGWITNLIGAACNRNPGNSKLQNVVQNIIIKNSYTIHSRIEESLEDYGYFELHELGTGASGVTYRASRRNDQKHIVVKTIKVDLLYQILKSASQELKEFSQAITFFKKEADILSNFKHRHIVSYYDHLTIALKFLINNPHKKLDNNSYVVYELELLFLVMEYIKGQNLEELLSSRNTPLQSTEALDYIQQIGEALTQVHNKGILHRDVKPKNIMVCETTNDAVLIDFGIAREFNSKVTQTLTVGFTEGYAPPEQLEQKSKWGNYTDVYGLAATLYYLLTKAHPPHSMLRKSDSSCFVEPKKINSNISDMVNEAILWGMELEFSKRPQTVQQWLAKFPSKEARVELKPPQEVPTQSSILEPAPAEQQRREQEQAEYKNNLQLYEQEFAKVVQAEYPLSQATLQRLKTYQQQLGLLNEDVERAEQPIREPAEVKYQEKLRQEAEQQRRKQKQAEYKNNLRHYEQELYQALETKYPLDESVRNRLKKFQHSLGIRDEDVVSIEQRLLAPRQAEYERQQAIKREQEQVTLEVQKELSLGLIRSKEATVSDEKTDQLSASKDPSQIDAPEVISSVKLPESRLANSVSESPDIIAVATNVESVIVKVGSVLRSLHFLNTSARSIVILVLFMFIGYIIYYFIVHAGLTVPNNNNSTPKSAIPTPTISPTPKSAIPTPTISPTVKDLDALLSKVPEITDASQLRALNRQVYNQINPTWKNRSELKDELVYRLGVAADGAIVGYKAVNKVANDEVAEIPLPNLLYNPANRSSIANEPIAQIKVIFKKTGVLEISPWRGYTSKPDVVGAKISDPNTIKNLNQKLYETLRQNSSVTPTFARDLKYRVAVNKDGIIADYEPLNQDAFDDFRETPLPKMFQSVYGSTVAAPNSKEPLAHFQVVFKPNGALEVNPWQGYR